MPLPEGIDEEDIAEKLSEIERFTVQLGDEDYAGFISISPVKTESGRTQWQWQITYLDDSGVMSTPTRFRQRAIREAIEEASTRLYGMRADDYRREHGLSYLEYLAENREHPRPRPETHIVDGFQAWGSEELSPNISSTRSAEQITESRRRHMVAVEEAKGSINQVLQQFESEAPDGVKTVNSLMDDLLDACELVPVEAGTPAPESEARAKYSATLIRAYLEAGLKREEELRGQDPLSGLSLGKQFHLMTLMTRSLGNYHLRLRRNATADAVLGRIREDLPSRAKQDKADDLRAFDEEHHTAGRNLKAISGYSRTARELLEERQAIQDRNYYAKLVAEIMDVGIPLSRVRYLEQEEKSQPSRVAQLQSLTDVQRHRAWDQDARQWEEDWIATHEDKVRQMLASGESPIAVRQQIEQMGADATRRRHRALRRWFGDAYGWEFTGEVSEAYQDAIRRIANRFGV